MMSVFRKMMPREDKFFDMFSAHSKTVVEAVVALGNLLNGIDIDANSERIITIEDHAFHLPAQCPDEQGIGGDSARC